MGLDFAFCVRCGAVLWAFISAERVDQLSGVVVGEYGRVARDEDVPVLVLKNHTHF